MQDKEREERAVLMAMQGLCTNDSISSRMIPELSISIARATLALLDNPPVTIQGKICPSDLAEHVGY